MPVEPATPDLESLRLWHYTSQAGLVGIISSGVLRCSKLQYQNDEAEVGLALDAAQSILQSHKAWGQASVLGDYLGQLHYVFGGVRDVNLCASSFSTEEDSLSQWRGYGRPGDAYALGVAAQSLKELATRRGWGLAPCVYDPAAHHEELSGLVMSALGQLDTTAGPLDREEQGQDGPLYRLAYPWGQYLLRYIAPFFKSRGFASEHEWRLVSPPQNFQKMNYRCGKFSLIPYCEFDLRDETVDALDGLRIVVGPTPTYALAVSAAGGLLSKNRVKAYTVVRSASTFRDW